MKKRQRIVWSLVCALICGICFYMQSLHIRSEYEQARADLIARFGQDVVDVVVAKVALEPGDVIDSKNCETVSWVAPLLPKEAIVRFSDVEGSVVQNPTPEGSPLTALTFRKRTDAVEIPQGYVALSLPGTDKLGLPSGLQPGLQLAAYDVKDGKAKLITSNMRVISCSDKQKSCTVALLPNEVPRILEVMDRGSLRVVMPASDINHLPSADEKRAPHTVEAEVGHG